MKSKLLLTQLRDYSLPEIEKFVQNAVDLFSQSRPLFRPGDTFLLKPNLLRAFAPDRCVTTHPLILEAVCRVLKDASARRIVISDSPAFGSLGAVARKAGYAPLVKQYGVEILPLANPVPLTTPENIPHLKIAGNIRDLDHVINLPKVKSHCQMVLTLSIKNLFGLVIGKRKPVLHCLVQNDKVRFGKMLVDIARHVNPTLTVVDGIQAMQGNGPANGEPYPLGILSAGKDLTALDRVLTEILNVPAETVPALQAARLKKFGTYDLDQIELCGIEDLNPIRASDFRLPSAPMEISFNPLRVARSVLKQIYETGIREKLFGRGV